MGATGKSLWITADPLEAEPAQVMTEREPGAIRVERVRNATRLHLAGNTKPLQLDSERRMVKWALTWRERNSRVWRTRDPVSLTKWVSYGSKPTLSVLSSF